MLVREMKCTACLVTATFYGDAYSDNCIQCGCPMLEDDRWYLDELPRYRFAQDAEGL